MSLGGLEYFSAEMDRNIGMGKLSYAKMRFDDYTRWMSLLLTDTVVMNHTLNMRDSTKDYIHNVLYE